LLAHSYVLDLIARSRYSREQSRSLDSVRANIESGLLRPRVRIRAGKHHTYCAPHYLGGDVVADNNADDHLPANN
jgi:hypothetical protein